MKNQKNNDIFKILDHEGKGFLTGKSFKRILNKNGVFINEEELQSLMKRYDKNEDGKVSEEEFNEEFKQIYRK